MQRQLPFILVLSFLKPRNSFFLVWLLLGLNALLFAQETESLYFNELEKGSTILTITNRMENPEGSNPHYINETRDDSSLDFLYVTMINMDSLGVVKMDTSGFISAMLANGNDWLLFVHGDSKTFQQAVMRGFDIQHLYNINVIVFSWPSRDTDINGIKNFKNSKRNVRQSMDDFEELLTFMKQVNQVLKKASDQIHLSVFIHSLGNYYFENLASGLKEGECGTEIFDNIILNAAAVNQEAHKQWVENLGCQENIYITCNVKDFNLKGVRIFTTDGKQLGEKITKPLADNACYIHFTEAVGFRFPTGTTHTYFIGEVADESFNIRNFYMEILHGGQVDLDDTEMFIKREDGLGYDILF